MRSKLFLLVFAAICLFFGVSVEAQSFAITNARIVTVSGAAIDKGTIVIRNGLIDAVGANVMPPADAQVFDATGLTVYPGFIDALSGLGLQTPTQAPPTGGRGGGGAAAAQPGQPMSNSNYPAGLQPENMAIDDVRAGDSQFDSNRNAGFTTVLTVSRNGIFNGQSAVIDLAGDAVSAMVIKPAFAQHITFTTLGTGGYPQSLLGTFSALRQMFYDAQRQMANEKAYAANPRGMKRPEADRSLESLFPALDRQMPVVFNANRERDIVRALDLIKEFNLNGIIAGGDEAWKVADRLKAQNVSVLLSLNFPKRTTSATPEADPESLETLRFRAETPKGPAKLAAAGVKFAFQSGGATSVGDFFTNAGKAVENGLSKDVAIRAMTLGSAEILGVDKTKGAIDAGKIGNLAVVRGDIFGKEKFVTHVFVDGKLFEPKEPPKSPAGGRGGGGRQGGGTETTNISGSYSITIDIPGQATNATLNFSQQGSMLTGTLVSPFGTTQIRDGKVTADGFSFAATVQAGQTLDISVHGTVNGNQISGTIDSSQGPVTFSGTKNP